LLKTIKCALEKFGLSEGGRDGSYGIGDSMGKGMGALDSVWREDQEQDLRERAGNS
jgi:hypothetical protein